MIIETNFKKSPIKEGGYLVKIENIEIEKAFETQYGMKDRLVYTFKFFYKNKKYRIMKTSFFMSKDKRSRYMKFVRRTCYNYNENSIELEEHIGTFVEAYFTVYTSEYGDEYLELLEYGPTNDLRDENEYIQEILD